MSLNVWCRAKYTLTAPTCDVPFHPKPDVTAAYQYHLISTCPLYFLVSVSQHFRFVLSHDMNVLLILLRFNSCQNKFISVSV